MCCTLISVSCSKVEIGYLKNHWRDQYKACKLYSFECTFYADSTSCNWNLKFQFFWWTSCLHLAFAKDRVYKYSIFSIHLQNVNDLALILVQQIFWVHTQYFQSGKTKTQTNKQTCITLSWGSVDEISESYAIWFLVVYHCKERQYTKANKLTCVLTFTILVDFS